MSTLISLFDYFARNTLSSPRSDSSHHISCVGNEAPHTKRPCPPAPPPSSSRSSASSSPATMALNIQMPPADLVFRSSSPAASPPSRPDSPYYRPGSRSERLLRDTLRKADERQPHSPSLNRRTSTSRRRHSDREHLVNNVPQGKCLSHSSEQLTRPPSVPLTPSPTKEEGSLRLLSVLPIPPAMSRSHTSPAPLHQRATSLSTIPIAPPHSANAASSSPSSSYQHHQARSIGGGISPREDALRLRLENALHRGNHLGVTSVNSVHGRSQSLAASPVVQPEWLWDGAPDSPESTAPLTPPPTPPQSTTPLSTPPSPFNARAANQICRQMPAYVSFQDVEGLGEPPSTEDEDTDEDKSKDDKKWWNWPWAGRGRAQSR